MAEFVQQSMEEMIPELEEMERVGLFTSAETKQILRKRKAHEYKLRRRSRRKEDYLQYIQYEVNLLALVRKQRERTGYMFKRVEIDVAIVKRIHKLFKLVCSRFQNDVKLWLSHIEFCRSRGEKSTIGRLFTQMLQVHNRIPGLWVMAAKWEMEENMYMQNARSLLQRGLRFNPRSQHLWREYFRMELLNADKMAKRKAVLQLAKINDDEEVSDVVLEGKVALVVYRKAIEVFPDDVAFCISFLPICRLFDVVKIEEEIFNNLQQNFPYDELTLNAVAQRHLHRAASLVQMESASQLQEAEIEQIEKCCFCVYDKAVQTTNTEQMWTLYLKTCLQRVTLKSSSELSEKRIKHCLCVFERACKQKHISETMMSEWLEMLSSLGLVEDLNRVAVQAVSLYPASLSLWTWRFKTAISADGTTFDLLQSLLETAVKSVPEKICLPLWEMLLKWSLINAPEAVQGLLERGLSERGDVCSAMKRWYLEWTMNHHGVHKARKLYKRLLTMRPNSVQFFRKFLEIELAQPISKMKKLRAIYEDAVNDHGKLDTGLWLDYIRTERTHPHGNPENAGAIYWRAMKSLEDELVDDFVSQYTIAQSKWTAN